MTVEQLNHEPSYQFPKGLRVLAVDDDSACLLILDKMLKKCEYQVTTTTKAVTALNLLRENKDKFDLVITDVVMPDMDGFKLLELVGLEMDLPVIMLSAHSDHNLVMKGITHGACDYLLKPVSLEAVKTIWRHVIHKKDSDSIGQKSNSNNLPRGTGEGEQRCSDQTGKLNNNKRKNEENDEYVEEIEDPSTQKKPRVVWSKELHRKFLEAVDQLGIDKAVPKKIQQLMGVENLSRENVASHLQKFRMSIRKINDESRLHANMASAYNNTNSLYFRMGSYNGLGNYNTLSGSHAQNPSFAPYSQKTMMGRLNSPSGLSNRGISSSSPGMVQLSNAKNPISDFGKFHQGNQNSSIFQGMPCSEFNQLQNNKNVVDKLPIFLDTKVTTGNSVNSLVGAINNSLVPHTRVSETQHALGFGNQSSTVRYSSNWPNAVQPNSFVSNNYYKQAPLSNIKLRDNIPRSSQLWSNSFQDLSSSRSDCAWNNRKQDILPCPNGVYGLVNNSSVAIDNISSLEQSLDPKIENFIRNDDFSVPILNGSHLLLNEVENTNSGLTHGNYSCSSFGSLEDLLGDVMKQDQEEVSLIEGDLGFHTYSVGT